MNDATNISPPSSTRSKRKDALLEQVMNGTYADDQSGTTPATLYVARRIDRRTLSSQYRNVIREEHLGLLKLFDHDKGPHTVEPRSHRLRAEQATSLILMKRWIQRSFVKKMTVLTCEFDHLSKLVEKYGIVHYNAVTIRAKQLCIPVFNKYRALYITSNVDSFQVIFDNAVQATCAAYDVQHVLNAYRYSLKAERAHFQCRLKSIGIAQGANIVVDISGHLHGSCVNMSVDMAVKTTGGTLLVTPEVMQTIRSAPVFAAAEFRPNTNLGCYEVAGDIAYQSDVTPYSDLRFLHPLTASFAQRNQREVDLERCDGRILYQFGKHAAILQLNYHVRDDSSTNLNEEQALVHSIEVPQIFSSILEKYRSVRLADDVHVFLSSMAAVRCADEMKKALLKWNAGCKNSVNTRNVQSYSVHTALSIIVPGTDIFWGNSFDVVHAMCMSGDYDGKIIVTKDVYSEIAGEGIHAHNITYVYAGAKVHGYAIVFAEKKSEFLGATPESMVVRSRARTDEAKSIKSPKTAALLYDYPRLSDPVKAMQFSSTLLPPSNQNRPLSTFGQIITSENELIGTDWKGILTAREQERVSSPQRDLKFVAAVPTSHWVQSTLAQRQREEYERSRNGFGDIGNADDALLIHNSMRGKQYSNTTRFDEKSTHMKQRRNGQYAQKPPDTPGILHLGAQPSPLKTRKTYVVTSNYDPVRQEYPSYDPCATELLDKVAMHPSFVQERKERTGYVGVDGHGAKPKKVFSANQGLGVRDNFLNYGAAPPPKNLRGRAKSPRSEGGDAQSGSNIKDLFNSYRDWSNNIQVDQGPLVRLDGTGRHIEQKGRQEWDNVTQRHVSDELEMAFKEQETRDAIEASKVNFAKQLKHETNYNVINLQHRVTGEEVLSPTRSAGVRIIERPKRSEEETFCLM